MRDKFTKRIMIFGGSTIVCLVIFSLFYYQYRSDIFLTILMLTPMFSVILTRVITKEKSALFLKPRFKGSVRWYLAAYLLTPFVAYAGAILFFVLNPDRLDMINSKFAVQAGVTTMPGYYQLIATTIPLAIIINPIMGLISCFGEEFAWRGYLLPKLCEKLSVPKAVLLSGLIWGLWHAPIIATGFNYGTTNILLGIVFMTAFCMVLGIITAFLFFKTKTVWVVVIFHAAVNGIDLWAPANLFMSEDPNLFIGPNLVGAVGGIGFVVVAIVCFISICKDADNIRLQMEEKE